MNTDDLINALVRDGAPVRPLPPPLIRSLIWLACSLPVLGIFALAMGTRHDLPTILGDIRWMFEQAFALLTAVAAGYAAFNLLVPGKSSQWVLLPIGAGLAWLSTLGWGCVLDASALGPEAYSLVPEPQCLLLISLIGFAPAAIILRMTFIGAPIFPARTIFSAALAAAALGAFGLRFMHDQDLGVMVLVWQFGSVALIATLGWIAGPLILQWPRPQWSRP